MVWTYYPSQRITRTVSFPPDLAVRYGANEIMLDFPSRLRLGETSQLLTRIEPAAGAAQTSDLTFQARLALARVNTQPDALQTDPYAPPRGSVFAWELTPFAPGRFEGTLRIYAQSRGGLSPLEEGELIFALPLSLEVQPVLGLPLDSFRFASATAAVIALGGLLVLILTRKTAA